MSDNTRPFALISVSDKSGIAPFAARLVGAGYRIISTGGTARHLQEAGVEVIKVADVTEFPEILDGRVKTLHPRIHGALLADRSNAAHVEVMEAQRIPNIDVVVVNLYPFQQVVAREETTWAEAIENIDIGGPTMLRAAAKNHGSITVVVDAGDFEEVAGAIEAGGADLELRRRLALKAFRHTAAYDAAIVEYFEAAAAPEAGAKMPASVDLQLTLTQSLRYGENPHQAAALYRARGESELGGMRQLHGKELSYNNIVDLDAALELVWEFDEPGVSIIKHTNPAGCAVAPTLSGAYAQALSCDPISAFGGIVALNRAVDLELAEALSDHFFEIIAAPGFSDDALAVLQKKKNIRLIEWPATPLHHPHSVRATSLGYLLQTVDPRITLELAGLEVPTRVKPTELQLRDLRFAWKVCKHVKSNAIVLASEERTIGVGAGQMSRVDSVQLAISKSSSDTSGAVLASDAFFPFRDGIDTAASGGIKAIIQPGGSRRDDEIIAACDEFEIAMVFAGQRHFRH